MAFGLKQDDLIKYGIGGAAAIGLVALLIGVNNPELSNPGPVPVKRASAKPYASTAGAGNFDVSQAYYGEDEDDDYYESYQGEDDEDDYYESYPADIVVGDHTGHPGPGMPPGPHPGGPPPVGGGHPGPIHPGSDGHPGGPLGFRWGGQRFPLQRYHVTNDLWRWFGGFPRGIFPGTPQLGYPYHPQSYPFFTSPFQCQRWPFSMMPQCRRFRRTPFRWPWQNRRPGFPWGGRPGFPGHPGPVGHPGPFPGPHPGPGPH